MAKLEPAFRLTARSFPELIGAMEMALSRYGKARKLKFRGRKLSNEAFINAAVLHLVEMPPGEQEATLSAALRRLEEVLEGGPLQGTQTDPAEPEGPLDMIPVSNADTSKRQPSAPRVQRDDPGPKGPRRPKRAR